MARRRKWRKKIEKGEIEACECILVLFVENTTENLQKIAEEQLGIGN